MRQETVNIYTFDELSEEAQQKAIDDYRYSGYDYFWMDEWQDTLKYFANHFDLKIIDYSVGNGSHSYVKWCFVFDDVLDIDESTKELTGKNLAKVLDEYNAQKFIDDPYHLTGYCGDYNILMPILQHLKTPSPNITYEQLIQDCINSWITFVKNDMEHQESDEYITDHLIANEYEYYEDGAIV